MISFPLCTKLACSIVCLHLQAGVWFCREYQGLLSEWLLLLPLRAPPLVSTCPLLPSSSVYWSPHFPSVSSFWSLPRWIWPWRSVSSLSPQLSLLSSTSYNSNLACLVRLCKWLWELLWRRSKCPLSFNGPRPTFKPLELCKNKLYIRRNWYRCKA